MTMFRLLHVEDNVSAREACRDTVARYKYEKNREVEIVECSSLEEALQKLDNSFDGAIIDLKLADQGDEGNQVVRKIAKSCFRMPIAILTGTPDAVDADLSQYIGVFKKGNEDAGYDNLLDLFFDIYNIGLTRIMGGHGIIETSLKEIFEENIIPRTEKWIKYGQADPKRTEKALLRHILSHLFQVLEDDSERYYPEEFYLAPPLSDRLQTGIIVKDKSNDGKFVIMNPACDLVVRSEGKCKTDQILLVEIDALTDLFPNHPPSGLTANQQKEQKKALENNKGAHYHCLPKTDFFDGGFLNFRKIITLDLILFKDKYEKTDIQIAPVFVKDMVARFSAYYARQGQPDIDFDHFFIPSEDKN